MGLQGPRGPPGPRGANGNSGIDGNYIFLDDESYSNLQENVGNQEWKDHLGLSAILVL